MSMDTNHGNDFNKNTTDRNMNDKSVTAFLLSPRYRIYRHLLLQLVVVLITINVLWYEPLQTVSFGRRLGGCLAYFVSMNMVIYINLYVLVPYFLLKNRWGSYVLMAVITNIAVITFLSVTQGLLFEVILPGKDPNGFATFINAFSGILTIGFVMAGSAAISLFMHWLRYNLRIDELESTTLQSELKFLKNQINPHFLFNVLNTIGRLAFFENAKMTEDVVYAFADMMRYILRKSRDPLSSLRDELTHVQNYLKIQKIRLGSRLQYSINISEAYYSVKLPFLSLTTLVENSIKYAVENKASGGMIEVNGREEDGDLCIDIIDNGDGMSPSKIVSVLRGDAYKDNEKGSVGLYNINSRLLHYFGNEYALVIESENKPSMGMKVTIKVPLVQE